MDYINGSFELIGAAFLCLNVKALLRSKSLAGVSAWPVVFYTAWGLWNIVYYPTLGQWFSGVAAALVVLVNAVWLSLVWKYRGNR